MTAALQAVQANLKTAEKVFVEAKNIERGGCDVKG